MSTTDATGEALKVREMYIGGDEVPVRGGETIDSLNPVTGQPWYRVARGTSDDADRAVTTARAAAEDESWRGLPATKRGRLLMRLGDRLADAAEDLAVLETNDNGKLYRESVAQVKVASEWLYYFGGLADKIEGRVIPNVNRNVLNYTEREPLGVVAIITPWNAPIFITVMALAPALAAGNTVVIKPSEVASASIIELAKLTQDAGLPDGVVNVVTGDGVVGAALAEHPDVAKVAFTGGDATGARIASTVGGRLGQYLLELGGKSPNIVFGDADVEAAEAGLLAGIFGAAGQTCIAGSRALVEASIYEELVGRVAARAKAINVGNPLEASTEMGPVATPAQLDRIEATVGAAREAGAEVLAGGDRTEVDGLPGGFFYQPTVIASIPRGSRLLEDEIFGPVLSVLPFEGDEAAIAAANDTRFGLAAGVWTRDVKRAHRRARRLNAGTVWINMYRAVTFSSPFGGYKDSGVGRENGIQAIDEFLQTKSVWCELGDEVQDPFIVRVS